MVISGIQGSVASQLIRQLACNMHHHTMGSMLNTCPYLSGYMLTITCKAMQPGLQSGLCSRCRSPSLCGHHLSSPPSVLGCGKCNLKRKDKIVRDAPIDCATCSTPDSLASADYFQPVLMEDSIEGMTVSAQIHTQLFIHSIRQVCLPRTYLAHHELENVCIIIISVIYHCHYQYDFDLLLLLCLLLLLSMLLLLLLVTDVSLWRQVGTFCISSTRMTHVAIALESEIR